MKETIKSLRIYILFSGTWSTISGLSILKSFEGNPFTLFFALVQLTLAASYIYAGLNLDKLIQNSLRPLKLALLAGVSISALKFLLKTIVGFDVYAFLEPILVMSIAWYLWKNATRLQNESKLLQAENTE